MFSRGKSDCWCVGRVLLVLAAVWVVVAPFPVAAQATSGRQVTFTKDIAPILQRSCQRCHRPDSVAPMSLLTYEQARPYARAMKQRTQLRYAPWSRGVMPPWFLETNIGIQKMKDDVSLSDEEIAKIAAWADNGAPEGNPADLPRALAFADAGTWTLGKPDLIVSSPTFIVPAIASDIGIGIGNTPTGLTEDRYISSVEFKEVSEYIGKKPVGAGTIGSLFAIHHANVGIGQAEDEADATAEEDGGNSGRDLISPSPYEVGRNGDMFPPDAGKLLPARSLLVFDNMHIHSSGVPGSERKSRLDVGLRLHPKGYAPKYRARAVSFGRSELQAKPGEANQRLDAYFITQQPLKLLNYEPHMHSTGVRMCLEAIYGKVTETLNCAGYDHNWVRSYKYDDNYAPLIPTGTILHAIGWYDNTAKNQNVLDPRNLSTYGNSSVNNMFIVFNWGIFLTDEQYQEEVAKRREYLQLAREEPIGCPACYDKPKAVVEKR